MIRFALLLALVACGPGAKGGPSMNNKISSGAELETPKSPVVSTKILEREPRHINSFAFRGLESLRVRITRREK